MTDTVEAFHTDLDALDRLEDSELALLSWGIVDGGYDEYELLDLLDRIAEQTGDSRTAEDIRNSLQDRVLLTKVNLPSGPVWRTRMAETVRLLIRLRQLFPRHLTTRTWRTAPNLVSDFRLVARPRRFPRRDVPALELIAAVQQLRSHDQVVAALGALAASDAGDLRFAPFQVRSATAILSAHGLREPTATLVAAGTGSGKTKAFYLPALAELATLADSAGWTKLVAVYPRNELLKDQLQTALAELRNLHRRTGIQLTIGAFYGDTPLHANEPDRSWQQSGEEGYVCPFLKCPTCSSELLWFSHRGNGALRCSNCADQVLPNELLVSRYQMQQRPPDVLLTTTETLNRQLASDYSRHVFGVGVPPSQRPRFLLLDEVHTYSGLTGAQAAILLRRWRHAVGGYVHTVGLSATVVDGATFLADLVGVPAANVTVVEPAEDELDEEGKEYLIALRGDPASGTALLSTSIQAAMLLRRTLDTTRKPVSDGTTGTKLFVFTDDLDVTNRLLHFLRNAEGQNDRGRPDARSPNGSLANLRNELYPDHALRLEDGQAWDLCRAVGHRLTPAKALQIARTSSQDPGLERSADIVVTTASLEVGLDDDTVGAILQHKAPRDAAQFIQRRGRAGRTRRMRPWTSVVLSDYGRDRLAFQAWDALFDPQLRPARLPIGNRYVLRIQATYALLDWLAARLRETGAKKGYVWQEVRGPDPKYQDRRHRVERELRELLDQPTRRGELAHFVADTLAVSRTEVDHLLWDPPRAVLATVVPTLLRRIESGWQRSAPGAGREDLTADTPLPDFLPSALFQDLLLPEVEVTPSTSGHSVREPERMGVQQALREFAPGRVTHRFAVGHALDRLWIPAGSDVYGGDVHIRDFVRADPLVEIGFDDMDNERLRVLRPWKLLPTNPDRSIANSSNAQPIWRTTIEPLGRTIARTAPTSGGWDAVLPELRFHLHQAGGRLVVHRVALGSEATVTVSGDSRILTTRFVDDEGPVGLGFRLDVDGFSITIGDPGNWAEVFGRDPVRARGLRADWFRERLRRHVALRSSTSIFKRDWLSELTLAAIAEEAVTSGLDLEGAVERLENQKLGDVLDRVLTVVFQSVDPTQVTGAEAAEDDVNVTKLHQDLVALANEPGTVTAVRDATGDLLRPGGEEFEAWLRDRYLSTVAGAVTHAAALLHRDASVEDLIVDPGRWRDGQAIVRISEHRPGGVGVVEGIFNRYQEDPRRFWRLASGVVDASEHEIVDSELSRIVQLAATDDNVVAATAHVRDARTQTERTAAWRGLIRELDEHGATTTHAVRVALSSRLLRPATSKATDQLLHGLLQRWTSIEESLGLELDARVFAHLASEDTTLDASLELTIPTQSADRTWRFNAILSLLWPRGSVLRSRPLELWQPYCQLAAPERTLLAERLTPGVAWVDLRSTGGAPLEAVTRSLEAHGAAIVAGPNRDPALRRQLLQALVEPVDVGVLELHPRIVGVRRTPTGPAIELEIPEVFE